MPGWWPHGEAWPPADRHADRVRADQRVPIRLAILLAVALHLVVLGVLALVRLASWPFGIMPFAEAWPLSVSILIVGISWVFVMTMRTVGTPLGDIVSAADRVAAGDLSVRLDEQGLPWLRRVAHAFNSMTQRLERQQRDRRALMADIAHELRTPLAVIQGRVEGMLDGVYPRDESHVRQVLDETRLLARLVEDLRTAAHLESGTLTLVKEATDLGVLIEETADMFRAEADSRQIRVELRAGELPLMTVDPLRIKEVLVNLLSNAVRHSPTGGVVQIDAEPRPGAVVIRVTDHGPGMPSQELARIFDRFYKGPASKGSGLGLTIAKSLVIAHGGTIDAKSGPRGGTTVTIALPL
jgi:signal transduction histidine kinase